MNPIHALAFVLLRLHERLNACVLHGAHGFVRHAILRVDLVPVHVQRLRRDMEQRCEERGARLLDFVVDFGAVKGSADEYPAWSYLRNGWADVLLVVRVPVFDSRPTGDLLESLAMPEGQAVAWVTVPELRRLGLLPSAVSVPGMARQRAEELRGKRFPFAAIARWLDSEGYAAPSEGRGHWASAEVVALLRSAEAASEGGQMSEASDGAAGML